MEMKLTDLPNNELPSVLYNLEIYRTNLSNADIYSIEHTLRRYIEKYPYVSFLMAISNVKSSSCYKKVIRTGKRGRPKTEVLGLHKPLHLHIIAIGDDKHSAHAYMRKVKAVIEKRIGNGNTRIISKGKESAGFIGYCCKQSKPIKTGGKFNFADYY